MTVGIADLLSAFKLLRNQGAPFSSAQSFREEFVEDRSVFLIKHDVHRVSASLLVRLAHGEQEIGIQSTYFVRQLDQAQHDLDCSAKAVLHLAEEMRQMGHAVGLHFDPWTSLRNGSGTLDRQLLQQIDELELRAHGPVLVNLHGNTKLALRNPEGQNLTYELFSELARDVSLVGVSQDARQVLETNRIDLSTSGVDVWMDTWPWFAGLGIVPFSYITDNFSHDPYLLRASRSSWPTNTAPLLNSALKAPLVGPYRPSSLGRVAEWLKVKQPDSPACVKELAGIDFSQGRWMLLTHPQFLMRRRGRRRRLPIGRRAGWM